MILSSEQERARTAILQWYRSPHRKPWFYLCGYGGTGKSTVVTAITDSIKGDVLYAAPTGQAAKVMASKGCSGAQTIHSLIYKPSGTGGDRVAIEKLQDELTKLDPATPLAIKLQKDLKGLLQGVKPLFTLNPDSILRDANLLVVDEVSMCGQDIIEDLLSFGVPLLLLGDSGQLPPVMQKSFLSNEEADYELTEIHRQSADSPIIRLATQARLGQRLSVGDYGQGCKVVTDIDPQDAIAHDQIIVGTHVKRYATNRKVRELLGYEGPYPNVGERLICRRNNNQLGLMNGDQFYTTSFALGTPGKCILGIENDDLKTRVIAHTEYFHEKKPDPWNIRSAECFEPAASITCHSSQGGQWPSVFVLDESRKFGKDKNRWLYTAISRASSRITVKLT